ncbi:MAG: GNAT family N-acetyltransferase [Planctomycetota bacterium]
MRPLSVDELEPVELSPAVEGPQHLYLRNRIHEERGRILRGEGEEAAGEFVGVFSRDGFALLAWFDRGGAIVLSDGPREAGAALKRLALDAWRGFRVVIGAREPAHGFVEAIGRRVDRPVWRSQPFYVVERGQPLGGAGPVRHAREADVDWLVEASLRLNHEDLGVDPDRIDRPRLRDRIRERTEAGRVWLLEQDGRAVAKLDVGCIGPAGALIEGVFTEPSHRGHGLASGLVAAVLRELLAEVTRVGLHVGRANAPAIKAYEQAGMHEVADLWLARFDWPR